MAEINISKLVKVVLETQQTEIKITEFKKFFKTYLIGIKNRQEVLNQLFQLCGKFQKIQYVSPLIINSEYNLLENEVLAFLRQNFSEDVILLYNKKIPEPKPKREIEIDKPFWVALLLSISNSFETVNEQYRQEFEYRKNFLLYLYNCFNNYGLHSNILLRNNSQYKRYNIQIEHNFKSKNLVTEEKLFLKPEILQNDYLTFYENKKPILINGKLLTIRSIAKIKITSTLLLDDEIELFGLKNNFSWKPSLKDYNKFISLCKDETDVILKHPYFIKQTILLRNNTSNFVNPIRIGELRKIKSKSFDFIKLIQLCTELNNVTINENYISSSLLVRSIIDHIPPFFGMKNFNEVANNYSKGTRSFMKSMQNLNNSLRNIADNNIHSQIRKKEILPTPNQIDFSQDLDVLLSEIIRTAK